MQEIDYFDPSREIFYIFENKLVFRIIFAYLAIKNNPTRFDQRVKVDVICYLMED